MFSFWGDSNYFQSTNWRNAAFITEHVREKKREITGETYNIMYGIRLQLARQTGNPQGQPIHSYCRIYCLVVAKAMRCCEPWAHVYIEGLHSHILGEESCLLTLHSGLHPTHVPETWPHDSVSQGLLICLFGGGGHQVNVPLDHHLIINTVSLWDDANEP